MIMDGTNVKYAIDKNYIPAPRRFGDNLLYQVGKIHCEAEHVIALHAHLNWYELTVVTGGKGSVITNGVSVDVSKGDIYLSFPSEFHEIRSSSDDPLKFCFFAFWSEREDIRHELEEISQRCMLADYRIFRDERVNFLVGNVISELTSEQIYSEEQVRAMMEQITYYTIRGFMSLEGVRREKSVSKPEEFCYRIMNYIDTHIYTISSLADVVEEMHYNYSYISDLFKKTTGETLSAYYRRRRLDAAKLLLLEGKLSVTQISELLNFSSIYTFSRSYKDYFGVSPNESRKMTQGQNENSGS
jgi:AraC-like DNA-binding protein/mannose-6-phosphate isomerase-like protein (cupin superfamily)